MSELDAQADSPLPTTLTPAMQEAMLRYHVSGGALGAGIAHAIDPIVPLRDIYHGLTTTEPSESEQDATRGAALSGLLSFIGPMGAGKGAGLAMAVLPAAKKLAKPLSEAAAESFRAALPKSLPPDHTETIISAIKDALGGDWDHVSQMPVAGSQWEKIPQNTTVPKLNSQDWSDNTATQAANWLFKQGHAEPGQTNPMSNHQVITWAKGKGMPELQGISWNGKTGKWEEAGKVGPSSKLPSLADEDIDAKLAANPGMSLFDLAGVAPKEDKHIPVDTDTLPRGATWQLPEATRAAASEQGYNVLLHHGTRTPVIFDQFRLPDDEIGVHFGSPRAAQEIQGSTLDWSTAPRVYPTAIVAQNPLRTSDLGSWSPQKVASYIASLPGFNHDEVKSALYKGAEQAADPGASMFPKAIEANRPGVTELMTKNMRDYLQSKGYDSIVYKNKVEDKGHDSYILFRESPSSPGHTYGARLPWADFDPSKFTSANIKAGIPLAGATAAYAASHDGKLQEVKDVDHNPFPGEQM